MSSMTSIHSSDPLLWAPWEMDTQFTMQGWRKEKSWGPRKIHPLWDYLRKSWRSAPDDIEMADRPGPNAVAKRQAGPPSTDSQDNDDPPVDVESEASHVPPVNTDQDNEGAQEQDVIRELRNIYIKTNPLRAMGYLRRFSRNSRYTNHWAVVVAGEDDIINWRPLKAWDMIQVKQHIHLRIGIIREMGDYTGRDVFDHTFKLGETDLTDEEISREAVHIIEEMSGMAEGFETPYSLMACSCQHFAYWLGLRIYTGDDSKLRDLNRRFTINIGICVAVANLFLGLTFGGSTALILPRHFPTAVEDGLLAVAGLLSGGITLYFIYTVSGVLFMLGL